VDLFRLERASVFSEQEIEHPIAGGIAEARGNSATMLPQVLETPRQRGRRARADFRALQSRMAAASGSLDRSAHRVLQTIRDEAYSVSGDPTVLFHLKIDLDEGARPKSLSLWLDRRVAEVTLEEIVRRYVEARISVPGPAPSISVPLRRAEGTFNPPGELLNRPEEWIDRVVIELIDDAGGKHLVEQD
jgi:hypothetical protein